MDKTPWAPPSDKYLELERLFKHGYRHYYTRTRDRILPSTIPGATLEKRKKAVNKEYHDRTKKLNFELHGTQEDQRGPIESALKEYGHSGRVLAPVIGQYGDASSDLSLIWDLIAREMARKHTASYDLQHWLFGSQSPVQTEACMQMG